MKEYTYTQTRQNLKKILMEVLQDHEEVRVNQRDRQPVIMVSEADYLSLLETAYLLRSPENAKRLIEAKKRGLKESISYEEMIKINNAS